MAELALTAAEEASMRADMNMTLPESGTIQRLSLASDGMGGGTPTWTAVGTASCRLAPYTRLPVEVILAGRVGAVADWIVTFPQGTDITATDRVHTGGRSFEVLAVHAARSYEISCRVFCKEVT